MQVSESGYRLAFFWPYFFLDWTSRKSRTGNYQQCMEGAGSVNPQNHRWLGWVHTNVCRNCQSEFFSSFFKGTIILNYEWNELLWLIRPCAHVLYTNFRSFCFSFYLQRDLCSRFMEQMTAAIRNCTTNTFCFQKLKKTRVTARLISLSTVL
jgi:hypothetical protein